MHSDFRKTCFLIETMQNINKTRGADKCKQISKKGVRIQAKSMNNGPRSSTKTIFKNTPQKNKKHCQQWLPNRSQKLRGSSGWRVLGHFWWPRPLWGIRSGPERFQSASNDRKMKRECHKRIPRWHNKNTKSQAFPPPKTPKTPEAASLPPPQRGGRPAAALSLWNPLWLCSYVVCGSVAM